MRLERARLTGETLRQLTLPGLEAAKSRSKSAPVMSIPRAWIRGCVAGHPDSMVTLAFYQGRQAFTVIGPSETPFLDAEAHEPGDVLVKQIDPAKYVTGQCGVN